MPLSLRDYVQETGRGGRDCKLACCVLFFSHKDKAKAEQIVGLTNNGTGKKLKGKEQRDAEEELNKVISYAMTGDVCRYSLLARCVTIDEAEPLDQRCSNNVTCDNCSSMKFQNVNSLPVLHSVPKCDITDIVSDCLQVALDLVSSKDEVEEGLVENSIREFILEQSSTESNEKKMYILLGLLQPAGNNNTKQLFLELIKLMRKDCKTQNSIGCLNIIQKGGRTDWEKTQKYLRSTKEGKVKFFVNNIR